MMELDSHVVVLDTDEPRVPSEDEVKEYGAFLGIDVENEPHLMWIAWEGVAAAVPTPWKACHNLDAENEDEVFYFNFETAESVWDHPCDEKYRTMVEKARAEAQQERRVAEAGAARPSGSKGAASSLGTGPRGLGGPEVVLGDIEEGDEESVSSASDACPSGAKTKSASQQATFSNRLPELSPELSAKVVDALSRASSKTPAATPSAAEAAEASEAADSELELGDSAASLAGKSMAGGTGLGGRQTGKAVLSSAGGKELDSSVASPNSEVGGDGMFCTEAAAAMKKRLQPITDEISEESVSEEDLPMPEDSSTSDIRHMKVPGNEPAGCRW
mmetsp:Transcript_94365/g.246231  ORF Transcript_94365/g.246231 Transcript_94365/m.246231 type:complete len:331 (+) Transcript_94365:188-1180(+)